MTDVRWIIACTERQVFWNVDADPICANPTHRHQRFEVHRHRSIVEFPEGTTVMAVSFDSADPYTRPLPPDYGLYLDRQWKPPWSHDHLEWLDFGIPDSANLGAALRALLTHARVAQRVEIGCHGGHGRTGTALAALAILTGVPPEGAVSWVRTNYCTQAIETPEQEQFVLRFGDDRSEA